MTQMLKNRKTGIIAAVLVALLIAFAAVQYMRARELRYAVELEYNRVFAELTEYVDDLEISLLKGQIISTPRQMAHLSADLYSQASAAKANLALLPIDGKQLEKTSEFLSQVGEYASCISDKMLRGEALSEKETKTMQELTEYAGTLKAGLDEMLISINEGNMNFGNKKKMFPSFSGKKTSMSTELAALEEEFHNYPSLIYDGPFSQHLTLKESQLVKGTPEITAEQAKNRAAKFIKSKNAQVSEIGGKLPAYSITEGNTSVEFTKNGGILLMLLHDRYVDEEKLSVNEAKQKAEEFLRENGFESMKESYYEKHEGSVVINYAYCQDDYIIFSDLVKVKIALDNGEVIGFESCGYIMNHIYRELPKPRITQEEALQNANQSLEIKGVSMAVIPLESGGEAACYQIKGIVGDKHFLLYVNTQTGYTEDVQILLESENGTLAV